jgi:hypothetical protein
MSLQDGQCDKEPTRTIDDAIDEFEALGFI